MSADFLDSNVFVYLFDQTDERKRGIALSLVEQGLQRQDACISYQVVQETLHVLTRKLRPAMTAEDGRRFLSDVLAPLWRVMPSPALFQRGLELQASIALSFYDALIVSAAIEAGSSRLLTEDLQHGQRIGSLRIENPFLQGGA